MKSVMILLSFVTCVTTFGQSANPDGSIVLDSTRRLQTEVFILNSCSPTQVGIYRGNDNSIGSVYKRKRNLSMNVNKFSAFKVININPLRYNYYINNQLVSQFFDANDISMGNFVRDTANLPLSEIEVLQIFNIDTPKIVQTKNLSESKNLIKAYEDSLIKNNNNRYINYSYLQALVIDADVRKTILTAKDKRQKHNVDSAVLARNELNNQYDQYMAKIGNELEKYVSIIENLTINNNVTEILEDINKVNREGLYASNTSLKTIEELISDEASKTVDKLEKLDLLLNALPSILSSLNGASYSKSIVSKDDIERLIERMYEVKKFASNKAFTIDLNKLRSGDDIQKKLEIYKIEEFAGNEKLKVAESFVLFTSLQIGKLLQNEINECSRFQNRLSVQTCLNDINVEVDLRLSHDSVVYKYIQDISSNLNVLIKFLELNNPAFNSTVSGINTNYKLLLKFMKTLDFVDKNNTKEFTLPAHNNLKNVDLIRYTVERRDKLRGRIEPYTYDIWLKGGLKVDFSVAILMSQITDFVYNNVPLYHTDILADSVGNFTSVQRTDSFLIKKADQGKYAFSFGGMVNVLWRTGANWVTPGVSIGVAYSSSQRLQFLVAGSLQFGKSERIIFHYGIACGLAQRIDESKLSFTSTNTTPDIYQVRGDITASVPYVNKYVFKPFFGISYNLSKKNALNAIGNNGDYYNNQYPH